MDQSSPAVDISRDSFIADKMRMNTFRLGKSLPSSNTAPNAPKPAHARSHSRNSSVSVPLSISTVHNSMTSVTTVDSPPTSPSRTSLGASKRSSHHRRRSSVSTRRESADLMGVSLPSVPTSVSDDNINLGDKDSVRRRALWALEGKTEVGNFSKVEIPEFDTAELGKRTFELPTKPSYPPGIGAGYGGGLSSLLGNKRDSFGKFMASSSSKEQLHTLMEEEEEEEESIEEDPPLLAGHTQDPEQIVSSPVEVTITRPSPAPVRHRPASLNLRPLSLASGTIVQAAYGDLPTPALTPTHHPGLKSLTLAASPSLSSNSATTMGSNKRQSLVMPRSFTPPSILFGGRPSLNVSTEGAAPILAPPTRRSSISYISSTPPLSAIGLPTPEMTPVSATMERRPSSASADIGYTSHSGRPLSASEQHFLFQAHATLVRRITDLERALSARPVAPRSRPLSCASDVSAVSGQSEVSDEMLLLIADLKAERDELKKDVDGWRMRVHDIERQMSVFAKRVEVERRDAWVARERVGLLEVEKSSLEKTLSENAAAVEKGLRHYERAKEDAQNAKEECEKLRSEVERLRETEENCARLQAALNQERLKMGELERELEGAGLLATPRPFNMPVQPMPTVMSRTMMIAKNRGLGFRSIDSESSFTDVDSIDSPGFSTMALKVVEEVDEDDSREDTLSNGSDVGELSRYEDEEEDDLFAFPTSFSTSSFGSVGDYGRPNSHSRTDVTEASVPALTASRSNSSSPTSIPSPIPIEPIHSRRVSLSKTWTFPAGSNDVSTFGREPEEVDHFFGCLEDVDNSPPLGSRLRSVESGKNLFSQALIHDDDDLPPFVLPADVGVEVLSPEIDEPKHVLDVVIEEEEEAEDQAEDKEPIDQDDEFVGEVDEGGIKFTFNIPVAFETPDTSAHDNVLSPAAKNSTSVSDPFVDHASDSSFTSQTRGQRSVTSPSSIPRLSAAKVITSSILVPSFSTPVKSSVPRESPGAFVTPPAKRGGTPPTFIPQPRCQAGSPFKTPSSNKAPSFIPQPRRATPPSSSKSSSIPVMSPTSRHTSSPFTSFVMPLPRTLPLRLQE
ncbi:hypothetical protein BKA93DRAFT_135238 [Sparassis latifolia]